MIPGIAGACAALALVAYVLWPLRSFRAHSTGASDPALLDAAERLVRDAHAGPYCLQCETVRPATDTVHCSWCGARLDG